MNLRPVTTTIDPEKCIGCGACLRVCPSDTITLEDGIAVVSGEKSLSCGHCMAVCPANAIMVEGLDQSMTCFDTFSMDSAWVAHGDFPTPDLAGLMASRRSCRNFMETPIPADLLKDLIKFGALAPSGTNSQEWTFTCLPHRQSVEDLGDLIKDFFVGLNKKAESYILRKGLSLVGQNALNAYFDEYYESVKEAMEDMELNNQDRLFHGATACILIGTAPDATCPKEDAMLAAGNILLGAHTMGLGSCLIGFAVEAMKADKSIKQKLNIPGREKIHAVIALGFPDESYERITGRKKPVIRFS